MNNYLNKKKLVAFDLDGTLIDSMPKYAEMAANLMVKEYGTLLQQASADYYRTSGIPFFKQLEELYPGNRSNISIAESYEQQKEEFIKQQGFPMDVEVSETLIQLQEQGIKIAISTSNSPEILKISLNRWPVHFDAVLGYEGENFQKGKSHLRWLADHFNLQLAEILFVGDSRDDYLLAKDTDVDFVAILGSFTQEQFIQLNQNISCIHKISDLLA